MNEHLTPENDTLRVWVGGQHRETQFRKADTLLLFCGLLENQKSIWFNQKVTMVTRECTLIIFY